MNPTATSAEHISICICTYRRNELLERLLRNLAIQRTGGQFTYSIVVVDNDPAGPARDTVARVKAELALDLTYAIEPEHTIPAARNHALRLAHGDYVGIIDDDEFPPPDWLLHLHEGIRTFNVDGALGPVRPFIPSAAPAWLVKSRICDSPVHRTGTLLHWSQMFTNNALVRKDVFDRHGLCFDMRFLTGGSDQEFFRQAMARGCQFVAVAEAPVYEVIPPARWTRTYWIKRALVNGFNSRRYTAGWSGARKALLTLSSAVKAAIYTLVLPLYAVGGTHRLIIVLEKACYHLSRASAGFGIELWKRRDF